MKKYIFSIFFFISLLSSMQVFAQFQREEFGKNRIQFRSFEWKYISTQNFDVYYYEGGTELATLAAKYAELDFSSVTDVVGFSPYSRIKLFVYQSISDMQQSNIGVSAQGLKLGGQTRFVRSEIETAFTGNKYTFRNELKRNIADMLIFEMMYGGNLKELLQSSYLLNLPEWFMAGAADYIAEGWSVEMDNAVRELISKDMVKNPDKFEGEEARLIGQSVWNFVAEKYGASNIANILNLTRIVRNETSSIQNTLGIPYSKFFDLWKAFYLKHQEEIATSHKGISTEIQHTNNRRGKLISEVRVSPDNKYLAYTENFRGKYHVMVKNLETNNIKTIFSGGFKVVNQQFEKGKPLLGWKGKDELALIMAKKGVHQMYLFKMGKKEKSSKIDFSQFEQINGFDISTDGSKMVMSVSTKGQSDIYIYGFSTKRVVKVTNDIFDDIQPRYLPNADDILFSSNRTNDTVAIAQKATLEDISNNFNVYMSLGADAKVFKRLSNTFSFDNFPMAIDQKKFVFLSDQKGISHLYGYDTADGVVHQITSYQFGISDISISSNGKMYFTMLQQGREEIFETNFDFAQNIFTNKTPRQQTMDLLYLAKLKKEREKLKKEKGEKDKSDKDDGKEENTDEYKFDSISKNKRKKFLDKFKAKLDAASDDDPENVKISGVQVYENRFTLDNITTTAIVDPLRELYGGGFGLYFEVDMTDVLENHKINGGLYWPLNLNNSSFFGEYQYLKKRIDYKVRFDRSNLELEAQEFGQRYQFNSLDMSAAYPFNIRTRVSIAGNYTKTRFISLSGLGNTNIQNSLTTPDVIRDYAGVRTEFVYDNSFVTGTNMFEGTKFRIGYEHNFNLDSGNDLSFGSLTAELRHYQKIHKSIILATRLMYGRFIGFEKPKYILGGMNNWLFSDVDNPSQEHLNPRIAENQYRDLTYMMFSKFATNMRGFNFNRLSGQSVFVFNAELRIPLVRYFHNGTINSNFFRNLQLIGFTDVGSAWTGASPFKQKNSVNTFPINPTGNFSGEVTNFGNPFLVGYGVGARTLILGYYTKFDVAWGKDEGGESGPKLYVTLGYDF